MMIGSSSKGTSEELFIVVRCSLFARQTFESFSLPQIIENEFSLILVSLVCSLRGMAPGTTMEQGRNVFDTLAAMIKNNANTAKASIHSRYVGRIILNPTLYRE